MRTVVANDATQVAQTVTWMKISFQVEAYGSVCQSRCRRTVYGKRGTVSCLGVKCAIPAVQCIKVDIRTNYRSEVPNGHDHRFYQQLYRLLVDEFLLFRWSQCSCECSTIFKIIININCFFLKRSVTSSSLLHCENGQISTCTSFITLLLFWQAEISALKLSVP